MTTPQESEQTMSDRRQGERRSGLERRVRTIENFDEVVALYQARDPFRSVRLFAAPAYPTRKGGDRRGAPGTSGHSEGEPQ